VFHRVDVKPFIEPAEMNAPAGWRDARRFTGLIRRVCPLFADPVRLGSALSLYRML
jgi:hypothetical protein